MLKVILIFSIISLFFVFAGWLGLFLLEFLFDTSLTTAHERARTMWRYALFGVGLQALITCMFIYVVLTPGGVD